MIAIFWRELRNNAKWAVLAMLVLAATLAAVAANALRGGGFPVLVDANVDVATAIGFPACGLVLGLLAILPDYGVGQWTLLTHRPIRRWRIFVAKLLAATVLYLLAAGGPLAGLIFWAATPGNVAAPFEWGMVLPRLAHLLVGIMWVSAGMLVAAREARWMGSRLVVAGGAAIVSVVLEAGLVAPTEAFVVPAAVAIALAAAALGAFSAHGEYETQPWAGRMLGAMAVGAGIVAGAFTLVWLPLLLSRYMPPFLLPVPQHYSAYELDNRGNVYRLDRSWAGSIDNVKETYTDVTSPARIVAHIASDDVVRAHVRDPNLSPPSFFDSDRYVQPIDSQSRNRQWFYLPRQRTVEAFDRTTRRYAGCLGPDGFVPPGKPPQPFPGPLLAYVWPYRGPIPGIFYDAHHVWDLDTSDDPEIDPQFNISGWLDSKVYASPPDDPIVGVDAWLPGGRFPNTPQPLKLVIVCRSSISIVQQDVAPLHIETDLPISATSSLSIAHLSDGGYSLLCQNYQGGWPIRITAALVHADRKGRGVTRSELPELSFIPSLEPTWESAMDLLALPPVLLVGLPLLRGHGPDPYSWFTLASLGMALFSALAGRLLTRRYAMTAAGKWGWTICCGLLGVVGLLTLLCTRTAVARAPCPSCRRNRRVTQARCEHCGAPFLTPPRTGVEVFEENQPVGVAT